VTKTKQTVNLELPKEAFGTTDVIVMHPQTFIEHLQTALLRVPPDLRHSARIEISATGSEYAEPHLEFQYERPETDDERQQRERRSEFERNRREQEERRTYERLRAKFEADKS
jgi:hypothetical protein